MKAKLDLPCYNFLPLDIVPVKQDVLYMDYFECLSVKVIPIPER